MKLVFLLVIQFLSISYIIITGPVMIQNLIILAFEVLAFFLIVWTLWTIQFGKFSLYNANLKKTRLVPKGPFVYVRYPIYTSFLILSACWVINYVNTLRLLAFLILVIAVVLTVRLYESILSRDLSDFGLYKQKTYRLFPFVY